ncbi:unnamed protein product [Lactuca virosa]|uniref:Uncharacterized protein n=1 Tax=Lactuca virosa TaxID=75947 RepID=A0AAU9MCR6_9ASTR|nr:unnamed protein product [Lactuca virosa]
MTSSAVPQSTTKISIDDPISTFKFLVKHLHIFTPLYLIDLNMVGVVSLSLFDRNLDIGDEAILSALWERYQSVSEKAEIQKAFHIFLKQFFVLTNMVSLSLLLLLDTDMFGGRLPRDIYLQGLTMLIVVFNKTDLQYLEGISEDDKKLVEEMKSEAMKTLVVDGQ